MAFVWFGSLDASFTVWSANRVENRAFDHMILGSRGTPVLELEMTLVSWRNHFGADVYGEKGSAHISSLCKWGPSVFTCHTRVLPSGRPPEESVTIAQPDLTWALEYQHFNNLCAGGGSGNIDNDIRLNGVLNGLARVALKGNRR